MVRPSPAQLRVLRVLVHLTDAQGIPPSMRELLDALGHSSTNGITQTLERLQSQGLVKRDLRLSRAIQPTKLGRDIASGKMPSGVFISMVQCFTCGAWRAGEGACPVCRQGLRPLGETAIRLLRIVAEIGEATTADVAVRMGWTRSRVSSTLGNLREGGYVRSEPSSKYKVNIKFALTPKGQATAYPELRRHHA